MSEVDCPTCEDSFDNTHGMKIHHSRIHGESIAGELVNCEYCDDSYREKPGRVERSSYCSKECNNLAKKEVTGEDHPLYSRENLTCEQCGNEYSVKQYRIDDSRFCSPECRHNWLSSRVGEDHPLYDGGEHNKYKQRDWRIFSKKYRDWVGECENCGNSERKLQTHHDEPISMGGHLYDNTFTVLCTECHYGDFYRWHPPQLEEYIDRND